MRKDHIKIVGSKLQKIYYLVPTNNGSYLIYSEDGTPCGDSLITSHIPNRGHFNVFCDGEYLFEDEPFSTFTEIESAFKSCFEEDTSFVVPDQPDEDEEEFDQSDGGDCSEQLDDLKEPWESDSEYGDSDSIEYIDDSDENDCHKRFGVPGRRDAIEYNRRFGVSERRH